MKKTKLILTFIKFLYNTPAETSKNASIGMSPSGKATDFDSVMRRFESYHPNHFQELLKTLIREVFIFYENT
jgi:hypothetical protein